MTERPLSRMEHELLRILVFAHRRMDERGYPSAYRQTERRATT